MVGNLGVSGYGGHGNRSYVASRSVPSATICLPTYDEAANIEPMLRALGPLGVHVLVIDDNSPDGTGETADRLASELGYVSVLHRAHKEGLGPAYIAGFRRALESGAEFILEMDCDFSHDPADVPRLIAACEAGADLALGSRYVPGGGTENWGRIRRLVSTGGSWYARKLLGVGVRDLTGGFKCYRRRVLERIDLDAIRARGLRVPDRDDVPDDSRRVRSRRGSDRLCRPDGRPLEDEPGDRPRGGDAGTGATVRSVER